MILGAMLPLGASRSTNARNRDPKINVPPNVGFGTAYPPTGDMKKSLTYPLLATCKGVRYFLQLANAATSPEAVQ